MFDADDIIEDEDLESYRPTVMTKFVESLLTGSIIFSTSMFPFAFATVFFPDIVSSLLIFPYNLLLIVYTFIMIAVGIRLAGLFGCSLWDRLTTLSDDD